MYKLDISVLGVYILPLEWPCKIWKVYKAPRLWRLVYYSEKNGVPAVTRKSAVNMYPLTNGDVHGGYSVVWPWRWNLFLEWDRIFYGYLRECEAWVK